VPHPDTLLRRAAVATELTDAGYPTAPATLATKASRGGGPPYRLYGRVPLYRWGDALAWAEDRCTAPRASSSEGDITGTVQTRPPVAAAHGGRDE
jgi:hypothetical protein